MCFGPSGSVQAALFQCYHSRVHVLRIVFADNVARIQSHQVRQMSVRRLLSAGRCSKADSPLRDVDLCKIACLSLAECSLFVPFFYLSAVADHDRIQVFLFLSPLSYQILVYAESLCRCDRIFKVLPDKLLVIGSTCYDRSVLRRVGRRGYISLLAVAPVKSFIPEVRYRLHGRIELVS